MKVHNVFMEGDNSRSDIFLGTRDINMIPLLFVRITAKHPLYHL